MTWRLNTVILATHCETNLYYRVFIRIHICTLNDLKTQRECTTKPGYEKESQMKFVRTIEHACMYVFMLKQTHLFTSPTRDK